MNAVAPGLIDEVGALAREWGRDDVVDALERARVIGAEPVSTVVVAGDIKRGKSRFVNALVGGRICPVAASVASNAFITVGFRSRPEARVVTAARPEGFAVGLDEVPRWASEQGNPRNVSAVERVEAAIPSPLLAEGLRVIDTPGVGGLNAAHRQVSLATLRRADALLFVLDPEAPLSRPEYDFLAEASERIGSVLFILTKADLYLDWETIAAEDLRLIAAHAPRFRDAPLLAVSSPEKEAADREDDAELLEESGFPAVEALLRERVIGRAVKLRLWNLARTASAAVEALEVPERIALGAEAAPEAARAAVEAARAEAAPEAARAAVEAARAAAAAHAERTRTWTAPLFLEHQRQVANPVQLDLRRRIRELSDTYERRLAAGPIELGALRSDLDAELRALALDMRDEIVRATDGLLEQFAEMYGLELAARPAAALASGALPLELPSLEDTADVPSDADPARRMVAAGSVTRSALYGRSLAAAMGPLGLALGIAVSGVAMVGGEWAQRRSRDRQAGRALVARAMDTARLEIDADLRARLLDAQQLVHQELRLLVEQRTQALKEEVARCEEAGTRNAGERRAAGEAARRRLERTAPLRTSTEAMCRQAEELASPNRQVPRISGGGTASYASHAKEEAANSRAAGPQGAGQVPPAEG